MPRYIDADACESYFYEHLDDNGMAAAMNAINDMPTIEPKIVRCKDCKFYRCNECFFSTAETEEDGFCYWAERKDAE